MESIDRYQKAINDTHKRLDFVIGPMLYLIPSDLVLHLGVTDRWNNAIQVADSNMKPGLIQINQKRILPQVSRSIRDKPHTQKLAPKVQKAHKELKPVQPEKLVPVLQQNIPLETKPKVTSPVDLGETDMYRIGVSLVVALLATFYF